MVDLHHRHPAFLLSCAFGVVGVGIFLVAVITSVEAIYVAAMVAGGLSLAAALYWRSLLVSDWASHNSRRAR